MKTRSLAEEAGGAQVRLWVNCYWHETNNIVVAGTLAACPSKYLITCITQFQAGSWIFVYFYFYPFVNLSFDLIIRTVRNKGGNHSFSRWRWNEKVFISLMHFDIGGTYPFQRLKEHIPALHNITSFWIIFWSRNMLYPTINIKHQIESRALFGLSRYLFLIEFSWFSSHLFILQILIASHSSTFNLAFKIHSVS